MRLVIDKQTYGGLANNNDIPKVKGRRRTPNPLDCNYVPLRFILIPAIKPIKFHSNANEPPAVRPMPDPYY